MLCSNRKTSSNLVNVYYDVAEDNEKKKEHYQSSWLELVMESRPKEKLVLFEKDASKKESYEQEQVTHFLVRRSPEQRIGLGRQWEKLKEYQLPYKNVLPVPVFRPSKAIPFKDSKRAPTPADLKSVLEFGKTLSSGLCAEKRPVSQITRDMPKITQPIRMNYKAYPPGGTSQSLPKRW